MSDMPAVAAQSPLLPGVAGPVPAAEPIEAGPCRYQEPNPNTNSAAAALAHGGNAGPIPFVAAGAFDASGQAGGQAGVADVRPGAGYTPTERPAPGAADGDGLLLS